jgi:hypothetical protein
MEKNIKHFLIYTLVSLMTIGTLTSAVFAVQVPYKIICHHTPGNNVTIEFQNIQAYTGHLGTPHNDQTFDTDGPCVQTTPSNTISLTPTLTSILTPTPTRVIIPTDVITPTPTEAIIPTPTDVIIPTPTIGGGIIIDCPGQGNCEVVINPTPTATQSATITPTPTTEPGRGGTSDVTPTPTPAPTATQAVLGTKDQAVLGASTMAGTGAFLPNLMNIMLTMGMLSLSGGSLLYAKTKKSEN